MTFLDKLVAWTFTAFLILIPLVIPVILSFILYKLVKKYKLQKSKFLFVVILILSIIILIFFIWYIKEIYLLFTLKGVY
ncbi:hypothetical protein CL617_03000 [archaeon]|nr:hypothetical protein [archaeon]